MFGKKSNEDQSNFWISYADLMAGLLFVFILLIGAIVSKSIIMREDLYAKEEKLGTTEVLLMEKMDKLESTNKRLSDSLAKIEQKNILVANQKQTISKKDQKIEQKKSIIAKQNEQIRLQRAEVKKLHSLLSGLEHTLAKTKSQVGTLSSQNSDQKSQIDDLKSLITLTKESLQLKEDELEKLNQLLLARNSKVDSLNKKIILLQNIDSDSKVTIEEKEKKLQEYEGRVIVLSSSLTKSEDELRLKEQKLADMLEALDKRKTKYDELVARLQSQKAKIISLTGIRLKVISALKETLGSKIDIDKQSGALRLASNILFDKGSSQLKEESKVELKNAFEDYIGALVSNEAIRPHLDRIVIEGHTDSDGAYLLNLKLSQDRALAVMNYLLTLPIAQRYKLKKYLLASGRAYLDNIKVNGVEDKDASRRIEIKFQLKNQDAMHEIERILDAR